MGSELAPVCVGVDVGQITDPMAIAVAEVKQIATGKYRYNRDQQPARYDAKAGWIPPQGVIPVMVADYTIRYMQRLPLGTSYPDAAIFLAELLCNSLFIGRQVRLLMDVTGVGRPVYDDLRKEAKLRKEVQRVLIKPISFVHGETYNKRTGSLGKAFLVSRLQSLLQNRRLHAPETEEVKATMEELRVYQRKISQNGVDTYGAKTGAHDDLATALGLACLENPFAEQVSYSRRVY